MSVYVDENGKMVITMQGLRTGEDYVSLRTGIIDVLTERHEDSTADFGQYMVLNLLRDLELSPEQAERALFPKEATKQ